MINDGIPRREPVVFCSLLDRFLLDQKQEQEAEQITHNTLASYRSMICQHIRPEWGDAYLEDVRPALIQDWLRRLVLSPKYKGHIRSLMYRLFDKAMLWELVDVARNPVDGRSEGHQQAQETSSHSPGKGCLANTRRTNSALPNHSIDCTVLRFEDQRNPRLAVDGLRLQAFGGSDPTVGGRQATQQIEDRILAGRGPARAGLHS